MKKISIILGAILFLSTQQAFAENVLDAAKTAGNAYTVVFENERMRALEVHLKKGDKAVAHSHPDHYLYVFSDAKLKLIDQEGKASDLEVKSGQSYWKGPDTHAVQNVGNEDFYGLLIELK